MALGTFTLDIQRFVDKANGNLDLVVRKIALDLFLRVIEKSPVDTGRFKSNWQVAIGSIPNGTIELSKDVSHNEHGKERELGKEARGSFAGTASISRVQAEVLGLKAGDVIYLVNNLAYSRALEYGHSKQAPSGMVRTTVQEFGAVAAQAVNEVPK